MSDQLLDNIDRDIMRQLMQSQKFRLFFAMNYTTEVVKDEKEMTVTLLIRENTPEEQLAATESIMRELEEEEAARNGLAEAQKVAPGLRADGRPRDTQVAAIPPLPPDQASRALVKKLGKPK